MRRQRIDSRRISPRRPDISVKENISAVGFGASLKRFADQYLRGAMTVTLEGASTVLINISLHDAAYMLRLMVEYGGECAVLKTNVTIDSHIRIDTYFPCGLPTIEELSDIARAGRAAGFFFEIRDGRIIMRAPCGLGGTLPVYASNFDRIFTIFESVFFI